MPIDDAEWEGGRTWETTEGQVYLFLKGNAPKAFTSSEIFSSLGRPAPSSGDLWSIIVSVLSFSNVENALKTLVGEGKIEARVIKTKAGEVTYYRAKQPRRGITK